MDRPCIDLNADLGESFGIWRLGHDEAMLDQVTSASIACGFHAGDPTVMRETVRLAKLKGVTIGAHPGFPDLPGFGRRPMHIGYRELVDVLVYQVGALQAVARAQGARVRYVKPHGALYNQAETDAETAAAVIEAVGLAQEDQAGLGLVVPAASVIERLAREAGLPLVVEVFADRAYRADGTLVPRSTPGAVLTDPAAVAERVVEMARHGRVVTADGPTIALRGRTVCLHGDTPGAPALARRVRQALEAAGVRVAPFA